MSAETYKTLVAGFFLLFFPFFLCAQQEKGFLEGKVLEKPENNSASPLIGANVYWLGTTTGTTTDTDGKFRLKKVADSEKLVISYIGYRNDTVFIGGNNYIEIVLNTTIEMDEVEVVHKKRSTEISYFDPLKVELVDEKELQKAACCNLSESFETTPSVDVAFTDAVTGTRQIQMLGLAGPYTQITLENKPDVRGLSSMYGLTFTPGTWVESIQLNKGTGSVVNGYESIAGQINVELRKPENTDKLYLNLYGNQMGRIEANAHFSQKFNKYLSTAVLLHGKNNFIRYDMNNDGFLDNPIGTHFIGLNRWKYFMNNGWRLQAGVKGTYIDNVGGQFDYQPGAENPNLWGMQNRLDRWEGWTKTGKVFEGIPWKSLGIQLSGVLHNQESVFGRRNYQGKQNSFYGNLIYQSILSNTNHKFKTGASFVYDDYQEFLPDTSFIYREIVPGAYFEYTFSRREKFNAVAGLRADYHNLYGLFFTPRLHLRYAITENTVLRGSAGRGLKTASVIAENNGLLASSREIIILGENNNLPYGLQPEIAWNYGVNLVQNFRVFYREGAFTVDFYRTDFQNQVVIDRDKSAQKVFFYNLQGRSFSNSFQAQVDYELIKRVDLRLAYRWFDVRTTYHGELMQKPLVSVHRAFLNLAHETRNNWIFDYTLNWQGPKRIPNTSSNPVAYRLPDYSPDFFLMNAQVTKSWKKKFDIYLGVENLLNFRQPDAILASNIPFSEYFDASMVWGPIFGRNIYGGLRYRIK